MTNIHAHVDTVSADCDGPMYRSYVETYSDVELDEQREANGVNDFSDIHFMERVLLSVASPYAAHQMTVKIDDDGIDVHEDTEEGFREANVRWCREDCNTAKRTQRDVFAEQMGY